MTTNRDLVNQMSNEELAVLMGDRCKHCVYDLENCKGDCTTGHALWLAAEAEPDKTIVNSRIGCACCKYSKASSLNTPCSACKNHDKWELAELEKFCTDCIYFSDERPIKECIECTNKANYKRAVKLENCSEDVIDNDVVNFPSHYMHGGIETIELIRLYLSDVEFLGYLKGNIIKYRERAPYKGQKEQDYAKALKYYNWLKEGL